MKLMFENVMTIRLNVSCFCVLWVFFKAQEWLSDLLVSKIQTHNLRGIVVVVIAW
jgi:LPS O-antigen subunit length determinant protein (WzzB/FepE family)